MVTKSGRVLVYFLRCPTSKSKQRLILLVGYVGSTVYVFQLPVRFIIRRVAVWEKPHEVLNVTTFHSRTIQFSDRLLGTAYYYQVDELRTNSMYVCWECAGSINYVAVPSEITSPFSPGEKFFEEAVHYVDYLAFDLSYLYMSSSTNVLI
jgi:hypothetical protein